MFKTCKKPPMSIITASGDICSFKALQAGLPLKSHTVAIDYTGNAISNCFVVNMADDTNISYFQGLLNGTYGFVDLGSLEYSMLSVPQGTLFRGVLISIKRTTGSGILPNIICPKYITTTQTDRTEKSISQPTESGNVDIIDSSYTSVSDFKTAMSGVYLIYELATPTTPTITETEFNTLLSAFNISGEAFKIPFDTPIYGGSYNCLTGVVTSNKDSGGGDITPTYQQTATAICETNLGENNIWADTGNTSLEAFKFGR